MKITSKLERKEVKSTIVGLDEDGGLLGRGPNRGEVVVVGEGLQLQQKREGAPLCRAGNHLNIQLLELERDIYL